MADFPDDIQRAYETFVLLCTHHGFAVAGMALRTEPQGIFIIGNVNERGHDFARLLRELADIVDRKVDQGKVEIGTSSASDSAKVN